MGWNDEPETGVLDVAGFICVACNTILAEKAGTCPSCFESGLVVPRYRRQLDALRRPARRLTAKQLAATDRQVFAPEAFPWLKLSPDAFVLIFGGPGAGKTVFTLRLLQSILPAVYVSAELGLSPVLAEYLRRLEIRNADLTCTEAGSVTDLVELANGARAIALDSVNSLALLPADAAGLAKGQRVIVLAVAQVNKAGQALGAMGWQHDADMVVEVEAMRATIRKSRYAAIDNVSHEVLA